MDRLLAMRTFVEIADRGSLTAAADAIGRSQPSVVRTLAALEKHLGTVLLRRTTRRQSLTPEGRDYLQRCRQIISDIDDAERAVAQDDVELRGGIRVTAPVQFGQLHIVPAVARFLKRHERVRIDLVLLDRNVDLVSEGLDLALRIGSLADSSMIAVRVGEVRRVTVASPTLLRRTGTPERPDDMGALPCIRQQNIPKSELTWTFRDGAGEKRVAVDGRFGCNQIAAAVNACVDGTGFGQFLSYQVQEAVARNDLAIVLERYEPAPWPVSLVYPHGRLISARLRALIAWLRAELSTALQAPGHS